jgi:predicted acyltransferase
MCCIIMAGVVTSQIFLRPDGRVAPNRAIPLAVGFSIVTLIAGRALVPLGISKIRATPTWSLYSIAASMLLFTLLYWVCDLKQWQRWAVIVRPAGSNTLLTYLLPDLWYFILSAIGFKYLDVHFNVGWSGVVKTLIFTLFMLAAADVLTKARIRLALGTDAPTRYYESARFMLLMASSISCVLLKPIVALSTPAFWKANLIAFTRSS